jgi:heterogeneous nuclear rnp K-like protein 2
VLEEMQLNSAASASGAAAQHHQHQQQQHQDGTHSVRLLIAHNRMGGVIGKGGNKIKEIQEVSGARLNASEEMLPNSTERVITIRGVPDMIHMAVYHIGLVVLEGNDRSQDRSTIHYKPHAKYYTQPASAAAGGSGNMFSATAALASAMQPMSPGLYSPQTMHAPPLPAPSTRPHPHMQQQGSNGNGNGRGGPRANNGGSSASGTPVIPPGHEQQQIFIPNDMVGCIIGKGGARINEIRANSACHIRVAETGNAQGERLITIVGPPEGCQRALYMLYHR